MAIESWEVTTKTRDKKEFIGNWENELKLKRIRKRGGTHKELKLRKMPKESVVLGEPSSNLREPFSSMLKLGRLAREGSSVFRAAHRGVG